jgi:excisionase family DNA binding protein
MVVLMTVDEVATLLRVSSAAVYKMVERDEVPGVIRIKKRLRFEREVLVHWLHQNRTPSLTGGQR